MFLQNIIDLIYLTLNKLLFNLFKYSDISDQKIYNKIYKTHKFNKTKYMLSNSIK